MKNQVALCNEELFQAAPSIFAEKPFIGMSSRYQFIPTIEVVDALRDNGFFPVMAGQSRTDCEAKKGMQRHMVKFRQQENIGDIAIVGNHVPEIILVNSHDGSSNFELAMGIFRFVCGNGMVVMSAEYGSYKVRHSGLLDELIEETFKVVADFPRALAQIEHMQEIVLNPVKQLQLAEKAMSIKNPVNDNGVAPSLLLEAKREDDTPDSNGNRSAWITFNVIQENIMRGGLEGKSQKQVPLVGGNGFGLVERKTKTRAISSIQENLRINKDLWNMASKELALAA